MGSALIQGPDFHFNFLLSGVDVCGESLHSLALHRPVPSSHHLLAWNPGDLVSLRALTPHLLSPRAKRSGALWDGPQTPGHYTYLNPAHFNLVWTLHLGPVSSCWLNFTFTLPWRRKKQGWMKRCHTLFWFLLVVAWRWAETIYCFVIFVDFVVIGCCLCRCDQHFYHNPCHYDCFYSFYCYRWGIATVFIEVCAIC